MVIAARLSRLLLLLHDGSSVPESLVDGFPIENFLKKVLLLLRNILEVPDHLLLAYGLVDKLK